MVNGWANESGSNAIFENISLKSRVHDLNAAVLLLPYAVFGRLVVAAQCLDLHVGEEVDDAVRGDGGLACLKQGSPRMPAVTLKLEEHS